MKKAALISLALLPTSLFAQVSGMNSGFDYFFMFLFILLLLFVVFREIICWYWKINKMVSNQEEIIRLLKKIAGEANTPPNDNKLGEEKRNIIKELGDSAKFMITGK